MTSDLSLFVLIHGGFVVFVLGAAKDGSDGSCAEGQSLQLNVKGRKTKVSFNE